MMDQNALRRVIRALWLADLQSGQGRSLEGYQDLFPGLEELVRNEIEGLKLQEPGEKHSVSSPVTPMSTAGARPQADLSGRLGPYRFLRELGRGGQAIVYLAEDERLHRRVALKVLTRFGSDSTSTIERFRREAEVTSRLEHPGICPVFDAGMVDGVPFIAMKHIEGLSLADRLAVSRPARSEPEDAFFDDSDADLSTDAEVASAAPAGETPIALPEALLLVEKVARALHAAHEAEIIHRDIKPGNIMIGREGEPVVLDFGLAQNEDEAHLTLTQTGDFFGTPAYMSPEQISAHRIRLDRRTDIFSLAATLYEITVGRRPFDAGTREGLYQAILTKQCPDPRKQNPKISRDLAVVLLTALEKDRDRRYPTALEFAEELRRVRVYEPIKARPAGPLLKSLRWAQRNRGLTAMIILAVLAAIVSGAFFNRQARLESRREEQARMVVLRRELDEKIDRLREASGQGALGNLIFSGAALDVAHRLRNLGKEGDERMKAFLQSDNPAERKLGMDIIPFLSIDDWIEELATIAMSDEKLAILASNILMRAQTPEVIPMLHHLVDESDSEGVRLNSLFGLCQLKDDRGIQAMLEQVKDPTKPYWDGVVGGILALRGPEVRPIYDEIVPRLLDKTHAPDALVMLLDYYRSLGEIERSKSTGIRILASDERIPDELRQQAEALLKSPD